jgi:hypothetical protein
VILDVGEAAKRLAEFSAKWYSHVSLDPMASIADSVPPWAETVGLIYDETDGLGVYFAHRTPAYLSYGGPPCALRRSKPVAGSGPARRRRWGQPWV